MRPTSLPSAIRRSAGAMTLALLCLIQQPRGQAPYRPNKQIDISQFKLPWDGPGAATFNPALLGETDRFDFRIAFFGTASGKAGTDFYQGSAAIPGGLYLGFAYFAEGSAIDGFNAVYQTSIMTPMAAYGLDSIAGSGYSVAAGMAVPIHGFNAFGAVESQAPALDLGAHMAWPSMGRAGRFHAGFGVRNLFSGKVKLPNDNPNLIEGEYDALLPNFDASVLWGDIAGILDVYTEYNLHFIPDPSEGPYKDETPFLKSAGVEARPVPFAGFKIERTWQGTWTTGAVFRVPVPGMGVLGAEMNLSHDKLTDKDEGRGILRSIAISVGI